MIDSDNWKLYELFSSYHVSAGASWDAAAGAIFDLNSNALRPAGWTSADAAGLPIFPGLVRYDEVFEQGEIKHALRFTAQNTRRAYVYPARHFASTDTSPHLPDRKLTELEPYSEVECQYQIFPFVRIRVKSRQSAANSCS